MTSFSGGGRRREPPTMGKQLVNFITCGCESSAPVFVIYKAGLFCNSYTSSSHVRLYFFCFRTEVEMSSIEDLAVSKYSTKKAFDKSSSFINQFEWVFLTVWPQSLEVSKITKNKNNFDKFWSSIINKGSYEMRFLRQHVNND